MARKPSVKDPRETPQAPVVEPTSAVTAPEVTPPAPPSPAEKGPKKVQLGNFTRIDH